MRPTLADEQQQVSAGSVELTYARYAGGVPQITSRRVAREAPVTLFVNGQEWVTLMCTPSELNYLAVGFLSSEGLISGLSDIALLRVCEEVEGEIHIQLIREANLPSRRVLTSGCGGGVTFAGLADQREPITCSRRLSPVQVLKLVADLQQASELHNQAGGVHTSALSDGERLLIVAEDVGRHNTLDKILGRCLFTGQDTTGQILLTTGRISTEMLTKAAHMEVPVVISRTSPTDLAVRLARAWGITLVGYVRGGNFNVYSGEWRISDSG